MKDEFLLKLADLCDEYKAEFTYTNGDDGIHILVNDEPVFVGFLLQPEAGVLLRKNIDT